MRVAVRKVLIINFTIVDYGEVNDRYYNKPRGFTEDSSAENTADI